jgi:hypothetical protein
MPADQDTSGIGVLFHGICHAIFEILLVGRVVDDGYHECVKVAHGLACAAEAHSFDHLLVRYTELANLISLHASGISEQERGHYRVLRVRVNAATRVS